MIWFGNLERHISGPLPAEFGVLSETARMQRALERVAEFAPWLEGRALVDALSTTGFVDRATAQRLLPTFRNFDPDRHFAEYLRRLSFRGRSAVEEFRGGVRCLVEEITGSALLDQVGPEPCIRFAQHGFEGIVLAQPEVSFTIAGQTREAIQASIEEMPDAVVIVARNFERGTAAQLSSILSRTGVPGTLVTVNLMLGIRASVLRYQPGVERITGVFANGGVLRSADIACLGDRSRS